MNFNLGDSYTIVHKEHATQDFEAYAKHGEYDVEGDRIYAFISGHSSGIILPLYRNQRNYIMTSRGDTFANVSFR